MMGKNSLSRPAFFTLCTTLLLLLGGCVSAPQHEGPIERGNYQYLGAYLDWMIGAEMKKANVAGLSIAIIDDQKIVWAEGYGFADTAGVPTTPDTLYRVGSISKLLTATEVMQEVDHGNIALDGTLASQLPGFSIRSRFTDAKPITVRALLAHHSGLPSDYLKGMWTTSPVDLATLLNLLHEESLATAPQSEYKYSNLDYSLLGRLIEVRSSKPFALAIQQDLLEPLGMTKSSFAPTAQSVAAMAKGYTEGKQVTAIELRDSPAGSLVSNTTDLARFISFVLADGRTANGKQLLQPSTLHTMFTPQFPALPLDFGHNIGLGWMIDGVRAPGLGPIAWHTGKYPGYFSALMIAPEHKLGVVILTNGQAAQGFAVQVGNKALQLALAAKLGIPVPAARGPVAKLPGIDMPSDQLAEYTGNYVVFGQLSPITSNGKYLTVEAMGKSINLIPVGPATFVPKVPVAGILNIPLAGMSVHFTAVGDRHFAVLDGLPQPFPFERVPHSTIPPAWIKRLGTYHADADDTFDFQNVPVHLEVENGMLVLRLPIASKTWGINNVAARVAIIPISNAEAIIAGAGDGEGGVIRAIQQGNGNKDALFYSGYVFSRSDH